MRRRSEKHVSSKRVNTERWLEAQRWELSVWEAAQRRTGWRRLAVPVLRPLLTAIGSRRLEGDDWNYWWAEQFDDYSFLPHEVGDFIELGCGPYTNTRLIIRDRKIHRIVCSDPLVKSYVQFKHSWLARAYHKGLVLVDDFPLEETPYAPGTFDVVVLINVLDHVYDFDLCMRNAIGLVRPTGYFLIGQDLTDPHEHQTEDVGHPIWVTAAEVEAHLHEFDPVLAKKLKREEGRNPSHHYSTLVYAGRKRL
jgi:SAM-dependent methyltransferase